MLEYIFKMSHKHGGCQFLSSRRHIHYPIGGRLCSSTPLNPGWLVTALIEYGRSTAVPALGPGLAGTESVPPYVLEP